MSSRVLNRYKKMCLKKTSASLHTFRLSEVALYMLISLRRTAQMVFICIFVIVFFRLSLTRATIYTDRYFRSSSRLFNTPHFLLNVTWSFFFWLLLDVEKVKSSGVCMGSSRPFAWSTFHWAADAPCLILFFKAKEKSWLIKILFHSVVIHRKWQKFELLLSRLFGCS